MKHYWLGLVVLAVIFAFGGGVQYGKSQVHRWNTVATDQIARVTREAEERALLRLKRPQITLTGYIVDAFGIDENHKCWVRRNTVITETSKGSSVLETPMSWDALYRPDTGSYVCYTDGRWFEEAAVKAFLDARTQE